MRYRYDVEWYQRIEHALQKKLPEYPLENDKSSVLLLQERVSEAVRLAVMQMKEESQSKSSGKRYRPGKGGDREGADDEESAAKHLVKKKRK